MGKWFNWADTPKNLKEIFEKSIEQYGVVKICTILDGTSKSGCSSHISAFVPLNTVDGTTKVKYVSNICIAREKYMAGGGMDMGFKLAYDLFCSAYGSGSSKGREYQKYLEQSWV